VRQVSDKKTWTIALDTNGAATLDELDSVEIATFEMWICGPACPFAVSELYCAKAQYTFTSNIAESDTFSDCD